MILAHNQDYADCGRVVRRSVMVPGSPLVAGGLYDVAMTGLPKFRTPARRVPLEMTVTEFKSNMSDTLEDARVGHISTITRAGRPIAAIVPIEIAEVAQHGGGARAVLHEQFAAAVNGTTTTIMEALRALQELYVTEVDAAELPPRRDLYAALAVPAAAVQANLAQEGADSPTAGPGQEDITSGPFHGAGQ